jgi:tetratricopeptide (TPR) repeat protein
MPQKDSSSASMKDVQDWMASLEEEWLLVLDNSNAEDIRQFVPPGKTGNILYTSRRHNLAASLRPDCIAEVNDMEADDAITLLLLTAGHIEDDAGHRAEASPIAQELGYLPLAIDQAGAYIRSMKRTLTAYLTMFRNQREQLIRDPNFKTLLRDSKFKGTDPRNQAVYATFDISYNALRDIMEEHEGSRKGEDARNALNILRLICFYHNDTVMIEMFERAAFWRRPSPKRPVHPLRQGKDSLDNLVTLEDNDWDPDPVMFGLMVLEDFSLVKWDDQRLNVSMHVLVHDWARASIGNKDMARRAGYAKAILFDSIPYGMQLQSFSFRQRIYPHVEACLRRAEMSEEDDSIHAEYMMKLGTLYKHRGQFHGARNVFRAATSLLKVANGPDDDDTLRAMTLLAKLEQAEGKLGEAEFVVLQVLELLQMKIDYIAERQHEQKLRHPNRVQQEGSPEYLKHLKEKREVEAKEDKDLLKHCRLLKARSLYQLCNVYVLQTSWDAAEHAILQAIEIYEEFGPARAASSKRSLARIRDHRNGNYRTKPRLPAEDARAFLDETISECGYGDMKTIQAMQALVEAEMEAGNAGAAKDVAHEFFAQCTEFYGQGGRETLKAFQLYAEVLDQDQQFIAAEEYRRGILELSQRTLGSHHPDTIESLLLLGMGIGNSGRFDEAEMVFEKTLEAQDALFGATHDIVRATREGLEMIRESKANATAETARSFARDALRNNHVYIGKTLVEDEEFEVWVDCWARYNHITQFWDTGLPEQVYFTDPPPLVSSLFIAEMEEQQERRETERLLEHGHLSNEFA